MFCSQCGAPIPDGSAFCASCGAPQGAAAPQAAPQPAAAPKQPPRVVSDVQSKVSAASKSLSPDVKELTTVPGILTAAAAILVVIGVFVPIAKVPDLLLSDLLFWVGSSVTSMMESVGGLSGLFQPSLALGTLFFGQGWFLLLLALATVVAVVCKGGGASLTLMAVTVVDGIFALVAAGMMTGGVNSMFESSLSSVQLAMGVKFMELGAGFWLILVGVICMTGALLLSALGYRSSSDLKAAASSDTAPAPVQPVAPVAPAQPAAPAQPVAEAYVVTEQYAPAAPAPEQYAAPMAPAPEPYAAPASEPVADAYVPPVPVVAPPAPEPVVAESYAEETAAPEVEEFAAEQVVAEEPVVAEPAPVVEEPAAEILAEEATVAEPKPVAEPEPAPAEEPPVAEPAPVVIEEPAQPEPTFSEEPLQPTVVSAPVETFQPVMVPPAPAGPASASWTCPSCGALVEEGNFCWQCGSKRPAVQPAQPAAPATWTCPQCGRTGNTKKFCGGCGTPRPA